MASISGLFLVLTILLKIDALPFKPGDLRVNRQLNVIDLNRGDSLREQPNSAQKR